MDIQGLRQCIEKRMKNFRTSPEELRDAFQVFDKQGNGLISVQDLRSSLTSLGERLNTEDLDELIREVDQNGEGMLNYNGGYKPFIPFVLRLQFFTQVLRHKPRYIEINIVMIGTLSSNTNLLYYLEYQ